MAPLPFSLSGYRFERGVQAKEAFDEFRKSFAMSVYHYWERSIGSHCNVRGKKHAELVVAAKASNIALDPRLNRIHRLANALKHNNTSSGTKLHEAWPQVFRSHFQPRQNTDWYSAITLPDQNIEDALDAVLNSGPRSKRPNA